MQRQSLEVQRALDQEIIDGHKQIQAELEQFGDMGISIINHCRQEGFLLMDRKEGLPHGEWMNLFNSKRTLSVHYPFTYKTAQRYMSMAKRYPNTITDKSTAALASREMWDHASELSNGHGPQELHQGDFFTVIGQKIMGVVDLWKKEITIRPINTWEPHTAHEFVEQMKPLVTLYEQAKERAGILQ